MIPGRVAQVLGAALLLAMPYALLRLLDDFAGVLWPGRRAAEAGLLVCITGLALLSLLPLWLGLLCVAYFCTVLLSATVVLTRSNTPPRVGSSACGCGRAMAGRISPSPMQGSAFPWGCPPSV